MNFLDLETFHDGYFDKVIVVYNYHSYLGVVFLNYYYCKCFCFVMIYLILHVSVVFLIILLFLSLFSDAMSISMAIITSFFD